MSRAINVFTSLVFVYSLIVCITCKQFSPAKVGAIEKQFSFTKTQVNQDVSFESTGESSKAKKQYYLRPGYTFIKK